MNFFDSPQLDCNALHDPKYSLGGRQILRIKVKGWGIIRVNLDKSSYKAFFWDQKQWDLLIPQASGIKIEAKNLIGSSLKVLDLKKHDLFKSDIEFLSSLSPMLQKKNSFRIIKNLSLISRSIKEKSKCILADTASFYIWLNEKPKYGKEVKIKNITKIKIINKPRFMLDLPNIKIRKALELLKKFFKLAHN